MATTIYTTAKPSEQWVGYWVKATNAKPKVKAPGYGGAVKNTVPETTTPSTAVTVSAQAA